MSGNSLNGSIPSSLGDLNNLLFLILNNNSLTGIVPDSLGTIDSLDMLYLDLSYNNLSSPLDDISAGYFDITGNPLICGVNGDNCSRGRNGEMVVNYSARPQHGAAELQRVAVIFAAGLGSVVLFTVVGMLGVLLWWRYMRPQKILPVAT